MSTPTTADKVSRAVRAYFLSIRAMDADAFANSFAENGTTCDPMGTPPISGRAAVRAFFESVCKNFKSVSLEEEAIFVAGNGAAVKWTGQGTSINGKDVRFEGIDIFEIDDDGKIQNLWSYWNPSEMIAQL